MSDEGYGGFLDPLGDSAFDDNATRARKAQQRAARAAGRAADAAEELARQGRESAAARAAEARELARLRTIEEERLRWAQMSTEERAEALAEKQQENRLRAWEETRNARVADAYAQAKTRHRERLAPVQAQQARVWMLPGLSQLAVSAMWNIQRLPSLPYGLRWEGLVIGLVVFLCFPGVIWPIVLSEGRRARPWAGWLAAGVAGLLMILWPILPLPSVFLPPPAWRALACQWIPWALVVVVHEWGAALPVRLASGAWAIGWRTALGIAIAPAVVHATGAQPLLVWTALTGILWCWGAWANAHRRVAFNYPGWDDTWKQVEAEVKETMTKAWGAVLYP